VIAFLIVLGKYRIEPIGHFLYSMTLLPQQGAPAFDPSWTLERELVFYALAVITVPLGGIPALAIVLAALAFAGWELGNPWSFHLVSTTQADFLAGVLVFLAHRRLRILGAWLPLLLGTVALVYSRAHDFSFSAPVSFGLILLGMVNLETPWHRRPLRWLVALGDASYSIYLLHYLVYVVTVNIAARLPLPEWLCEPWRYLSIALCCAISLTTWRLIERPMILLGNQLANASEHALGHFGDLSPANYTRRPGR
jgi:exopolysaccharide production protein ExoZ